MADQRQDMKAIELLLKELSKVKSIPQPPTDYAQAGKYKKSAEKVISECTGTMTDVRGYAVRINTTIDQVRAALKDQTKNIQNSIKKALDSIQTTDALRAVQAMVILGLLSTAVAVVCGALKLFVMKDKNLLTMAAAGLLGVAGLFLMIGFAVFHSETYKPIKETFDLHAGFAFCIIAWLACWIAAALFGLVAMKKK